MQFLIDNWEAIYGFIGLIGGYIVGSYKGKK